VKTAKFGLIRSVTVMSTIYLIALALAPTPGVAAPAGATSPGVSTKAVGLETTSVVCPYTQNAKDGIIEAHRSKLERRAERSSSSARGTDRIMIF
jgi:hypothetical protein